MNFNNIFLKRPVYWCKYHFRFEEGDFRSCYGSNFSFYLGEEKMDAFRNLIFDLEKFRPENKVSRTEVMALVNRFSHQERFDALFDVSYEISSHIKVKEIYSRSIFKIILAKLGLMTIKDHKDTVANIEFIISRAKKFHAPEDWCDITKNLEWAKNYGANEIV